MATKVFNWQYQAPTCPHGWGLEERRYHAGLMELFDLLFSQQVTDSKIADGTLDASKLKSKSVGTAQLADGAVTQSKISQLAVHERHLANTSVTELKLADGSVTHSKLGTQEVWTGNIQDQAVTTDKLAASSVTSGKIGAGAVSLDKLAADIATDLDLTDNTSIGTIKAGLELAISNAIDDLFTGTRLHDYILEVVNE